MLDLGKRAMLGLAAAIALTAPAVPLAQAQMQAQYPTRPVSIIIPFAAGGPTDTVGR